jgi:hypothetical protein
MRYNQFADYAPPTNVGSLRMGGGRAGQGRRSRMCAKVTGIAAGAKGAPSQ